MRHAVKCGMVGLAIVFVVCGCSGGGKANLIGTWAVDAEATRKAAEDKGMLEKMGAMEKKMFEAAFAMIGSMTMTISKDTIKMSAMGKEDNTPYRVKKSSGNAVEISSKKDGKEASVTFEFKSKDTMTMRSSDSDDMDFLIWKRQ